MNQSFGYGQLTGSPEPFIDTNTFAPPPELTPEMQQRLKDPFENPTEYHDYSDDYSKVIPWLRQPEYKISLDPARVEKQMLKRYYSIGAACLLLNFLFVYLSGFPIIYIIKFILGKMSPSASGEDITAYLTQSSIVVSLNMMLFLTANVVVSKIGLRWAKIKQPVLAKPKGFSLRYAVQYCFIGLAIWSISTILALLASSLFDSIGFSTAAPDIDSNIVSPLGIVITNLYGCIIAPITEEIFYRGMVMKVFSKANQRFAVFMSAFFFGLGHGNITQFILAFLAGLFFAHIDMKHNSILPSIIVHIFINTFVAVSQLTYSSMAAYGVWFIFTLGGSIIGLFLLYIFRKKDRIPATTPAQSRRGIAVAKTSVLFVTAVVVLFAYMVSNTIF